MTTTEPVDDEFASAEDWVRQWLAPTIARKLDGAGKGLTWCPMWWRHREVAMRLYALWRAWEASRTGDDRAMASWWVHHCDPQLRVILDGESGPMYRCASGHVPPQPLLVMPLPEVFFGVGWDPDPATRRRHAYLPGSLVLDPGGDEDKDRIEVFDSFVEWVEVWLAPTITRKLVGRGRGLTWCGQWWRHREAVLRLQATWRAWEAAIAEGGVAVSAWWVQILDPNLRALLDGEHGPMYRCAGSAHTEAPGLDTAPVPAHWFGWPNVGPNPACDPFGGFGPDPRVIAGEQWAS